MTLACICGGITELLVLFFGVGGASVAVLFGDLFLRRNKQ